MNFLRESITITDIPLPAIDIQQVKIQETTTTYRLDPALPIAKGVSTYTDSPDS